MGIEMEDKILKKIDSFPVLPDTVAKVLEVTSNPESSAKDLMQAVLSDQSMCIAILKVANSALFGQPKKVSSIERAIMILGFNEVQSIVLGRAVVGAFEDVKKEHKQVIESFWSHSFNCGLAAKTIAENMGLSAGDFFICGLIHDIGKLAMYLILEDEYDPARWMEGFSSSERLIDEKLFFDTDHTVVGSKLLRHWSFPESLLVAMEYHHDPFKVSRGKGFPLVIQLADFYAHLTRMDHLLEDQTLADLTAQHLPDIKAQWKNSKLPWVDLAMESWYAWLKIDQEHGSGIISIFAGEPG